MISRAGAAKPPQKGITMKRYYIKKINHISGTIEFKRYKCIEGFSKNKEECWQFTKQGAVKVIEGLKREYFRNLKNLEFELEEA